MEELKVERGRSRGEWEEESCQMRRKGEDMKEDREEDKWVQGEVGGLEKGGGRVSKM